MKIKTSELEGAALDWAVAKAADWNVYTRKGRVYQADVMGTVDTPAFPFSPSRRWDMVGPLIERYRVELYDQGNEYTATIDRGGDKCLECGCSMQEGDPHASGPTPLIAACRAIVAAKLGDEVDVPEELV